MVQIKKGNLMCCRRDKRRSMLDKIYFTSKGTCSSDGKTILFVPFPDNEAGSEQQENYAIPIDVAKKISKIIPKKASLTINFHDDGNNEISLFGIGRFNCFFEKNKNTEATRERIEKILTEAGGPCEIVFDINLLIDLLKQIKMASESNNIVFCFDPPIFGGTRNKIKLKTAYDGIAVEAVIMPKTRGYEK